MSRNKEVFGNLVWGGAKDPVKIPLGFEDLSDFESIGGPPGGPHRGGGRGKQSAKQPNVIRGNRAKPEHVRPLWPGMLYYGESTILFGPKGNGKSTIADDICASITTGAPMPGQPDEATREPQSVLILTAEDHPQRVLLPRLIAAGAELANVFIVPSATLEGKRTTFNLRDDLELIEGMIKHSGLLHGDQTDYPGLGLVVISPITAYLGSRTNVNDVGQVRGVLDPFFDLLRNHDVASLLIGHPRKGLGDEGALDQLAGSGGLTAAPRVVTMSTRDPEEPNGRRLLTRIENNLENNDSPFGFAYRIHGAIAEFGDERFNTTRIEWLGRDDRHGDELIKQFRESRAAKAESKLDKAIALLRRELAAGDQKATRIEELAKAEDIGTTTLNAAKRKLHVDSVKRGADWYWKQLPF